MGTGSNHNPQDNQKSRRRRPSPWWRALFPRSPIRTNSGKRSTSPKSSIQELFDLGFLATFLQIISILIMMGCAVTLLNHFWMGLGEGEDLESREEESSSWRHAFNLVSSTTKHVVRKIHHRDPEADRKKYGVGLNAHYPKEPMDPSPYYTIPGSMEHVGDKSDRYALLRKEYDAKEMGLPIPVRENEYEPITTDNGEDIPYDIFDCPEEPPEGYPYAWNILEILKAWPADDPEPRPEVYQGFCVFDYEKDFDKAQRYREEELPFIVRNDAEVLRTVKRWNDPEYLHRMLAGVRHRAEYSESNHFMYWNPPSQLKKNKNKELARQMKTWKEPTEMLRMTYGEWLEKANQTDDSLLGPDMPHWYFRLIGCGETGPEGQCDRGSSEYLFDELPFFQPKENLYMVEPGEQKGIHCRFGMKGVIAENHFDGSRNAIVLLSGERRYLLAHPDQCSMLALLPKGHPSSRHSAVDWSDPDLDTYPEFAMARGNEVVMQGKELKKPKKWSGPRLVSKFFLPNNSFGFSFVVFVFGSDVVFSSCGLLCKNDDHHR